MMSLTLYPCASSDAASASEWLTASETTEPLAATARRASEASHPARPTNVKKRPKGAFLLSAILKDSNLQQV